jgi:hypothetical protein
MNWKVREIKTFRIILIILLEYMWKDLEKP